MLLLLAGNTISVHLYSIDVVFERILHRKYYVRQSTTENMAKTKILCMGEERENKGMKRGKQRK
jgi:hypothetical protein